MTKRFRLPFFFLLPALAVTLVLLILPVALLLLRARNSDLVNTVLSPVATEALRLSLLTSSISLGIIMALGIPTAYLLARYDFKGKQILDSLLDLPLVLPPTVAGVALLFSFGRRSFIGSSLADLGVTISFTSLAVILAQVFVAAPLFIRSMKAGFSRIDEKLEAAAIALGANRWRTFWRISLPLCSASLIEGAVLAWARALGEFGATIVFAGSLMGRTQTMPLAIYAALEADLNVAIGLSAIMTVFAFALLLCFRFSLSLQAAHKAGTVTQNMK